MWLMRLMTPSYALGLGPKMGGQFAVVLGVGRWHIITVTLGAVPDSGQKVLPAAARVACVWRVLYAAVCVCVYITPLVLSLAFAARGRLAEIDPIPRNFRFLGRIWGRTGGVCV